jgi:[ribosomal protein S5]-alanine N-acetyltransferase
MHRDPFERTTLVTSRLRLEPISAAHAPVLFEGLRDERIYHYIPDAPPANLDELAARYAFLEQRRSPDGSEAWLNWAMLAQGGVPVGYLQATVRLADRAADIAYVTFPEWQRRGLAGEALRALLPALQRAYALTSMTAALDTRNVASVRLVESLGFTRTALVERVGEIRGESSDEFHYTLYFPG